MCQHFPHLVLITVLAALPTTFAIAQDSSSPEAAPPKIAFSAPKSIKITASPSQDSAVVLAGDFNNDGNTDVIAAYGDPAALKILLGDGTGGFTPTSISPPAGGFAGGEGPYSEEGVSVNLVDLNHDGKLDILQVYPGQIDSSQCNNTPTTVSTWMGDGKGGFGAPVTYDLDPAEYVESTYADFNGDGKIDIAVYTYNDDGSNCGLPGPALNILLNNGDGTFGSPRSTNAAALLPQSASIPLEPQSSSSGKSTHIVSEYNGMVSGDFNGDGKTDLVLGGPFESQPGTIHVLYGDGTGAFTEAFNYTFDSFFVSMVAADLNGDGKTDLVVGLMAKNVPGALPRIATLLAKKAGGLYWAYATSLPNPGVRGEVYPAITSLVDLNGDGKLDIILPEFKVHNQTYTNYVLALAGEGGGKFAPAQSSYTGPLSDPVLVPFKTGSLPEIFLTDGYSSKTGAFLYYLANESK